MNQQVDRQRDSFANAVMRQPDTRGQHAMGQAHQCLLWRIGVDGAQAPEVARVQGLEQVERFGPADFPDENAIGPMPERGSQQIGKW